jgi:hypothetical protein
MTLNEFLDEIEREAMLNQYDEMKVPELALKAAKIIRKMHDHIYTCECDYSDSEFLKRQIDKILNGEEGEK